MICPNCGTENTDGTTHCCNCNCPFNYMDPAPDPGYPGYDNFGYANNYLSQEEVERTGRINARRRKTRQVLSTIVSVVIIIVTIAAGFFVVRWLLVGKKTYSGSTSGLSFEYPRGWDQTTSREFGAWLGANELSGSSLGMQDEVILMEEKGDNTNCFLLVYRADGVPSNVDSNLAMTQIKSRLFTAQGGALGGYTSEDVTIAGNSPGYHLTGQLSVDSTVISNYEFLITVNGGSAYVFMLFSNPDIDFKDRFHDIISSIKFDSPGASEHNSGVTPQLIK